MVLVIDQLEELATLARGPSRDWLVALLALFGEQPVPGARAFLAAGMRALAQRESRGKLQMRSALGSFSHSPRLIMSVWSAAE